MLVITAEGAYRYDPPTHALSRMVAGDLRPLTGVQDFVATAPLNLVYVADLDRTGEASARKKRRSTAQPMPVSSPRMCISIAHRPASPGWCAASSIAWRWALPWGWARISASRLRKRWGIRPTAINSRSRDLTHVPIRQDPVGLPDLPGRGGWAGVVGPAAAGASRDRIDRRLSRTPPACAT